MRHLTDPKIRVHVLSCVLALAVAHLLRRQTAPVGLPMSVRELLDTLEGIEFLHGPGGPKARRVFTEMISTDQKFRLGRNAGL